MKELKLSKAFMLMEPGPVVLVTTNDGKKDNVMTISWTMVVDFTPAFAITTGAWNYSFAAPRKTKECVLAVPTVDLLDKVVGIGTCSGADTDKFAKFKLTPIQGKIVRAPLIKECLANIECKVVDLVKKHNIVVLEAVAAYRDTLRKEKRTVHAVGDGTFIIDGRRLSRKQMMIPGGAIRRCASSSWHGRPPRAPISTRSAATSWSSGSARPGPARPISPSPSLWLRSRPARSTASSSRPAVETGERLGFLPGDMKEKIDPYLRPLYDALYDMMPGDQVMKRMASGEIEIAPLAFMRGRTLANAFVILDEAQNTTPMQMKMFLTRLGENSRMAVTGDLTQVDLPHGARSGLAEALDVLDGVEGTCVLLLLKNFVEQLLPKLIY